MTNSTPSKALVYSALIIIQILFGLNYVISKTVVTVFPPLVWASIRIIIASAIMLSFALATRRPFPKGGWKFFGPLIIYALLGTIINQASFLVGLHYTSSTNSAILNTLIPVFTLMIVTLRGQESFTWIRGVGFVSALLGVLVLRNVENLTLTDQTVIGDLLTILNCFSFALFLSYSKKFIEKHDPIWTTTWMFIYGSIALTLIAVPDYMTFEWPEMSPQLWAAATYAVLGATLMTYFLNLWTLVYAKPSHVALFTYLQPVIASSVAFYFWNEPITLRTALATVLIFIGMTFGLYQRKKSLGAALNEIATASPMTSKTTQSSS